MIAAGKYKAKAVSPVEHLLWPTGDHKPYSRVVVEITEAPHTGETVEYTGWETEAAGGQTVKSLTAMGWVPGEDSSVVGKEFSVEIEHHEYEGTTSARIKWVNSLSLASQGEGQTDAQKAAWVERARVLQAGLRTKGQGNTKAANDSDVRF